VNIINSFEGVTLEVAGDVETYWKSMAMPVVSTPQPSLSRSSHRSSLIGSAHTSPSVKSVNDTGGQAALTISSLHGSYVFAVVQVTRDLHPVVYSDWLLPGTDFDLCVSDVTLEQFEALSHRFGRHMNPEDSATIKDWSSLLTRSMISLADLLKVCAEIVRLITYPTLVLDLTLEHKH
jgi:CDK inhibitor PHO81